MSKNAIADGLRFAAAKGKCGADNSNYMCPVTIADCEQAADVIDRLQAIVDKLPRTADGVAIVPGMVVYKWFECPPGIQAIDVVDVCDTEDITCEINKGEFKGWTDVVESQDCYSTREAAEAAQTH